MYGAIKKYLFILIILSIFGGIILFSVNWNRNKTFKSIKLSGLVTLNEKVLLNLLDSTIYKTPKNQIKLSDIKEKLLQNKMVESIIIESGSNDELNISITEKKPSTFVILNDKSFFAYKNGDSLSSDLGTFYPDLVILRLNYLKNQKDTADFKSLINFINGVKSESLNLLSEVYINNDNIIASLNFNSININLGAPENCLNNFAKFIELINKKKDLNFSKINYIDARWTDRLVINEIN